MATSTGRAGVATSCSVCASDQAEYSSRMDRRPLCWQCWRGEQIAAQLVGETEQERERSAFEALYRLLLDAKLRASGS